MQKVDTVIHAKWVLPIEPAGEVHTDYACVIDKGRIVALCKSDEAKSNYEPHNNIQLSEHVLLPGLINAHTHAAMSLFRGLADDLPLMTWLNNYIWPAESKLVAPEFVNDGTTLAIAEMLRGGTTCFSDMYFFPDVTASVASQLGIRGSIGMIVISFPSAWAANPAEYISKGLAVRDEYKYHPLLTFNFAPHAPYSVADETFSAIQTYADELDTGIQMHIHETPAEINDALKDNACRPLTRLEKLGLLTPSLMAVHMTQLLDEEIARVSERGCHVIHCPESNLKLASGFCPVNELLKAGVNVALGTDGAASNNDLDMFSEMRSAALLAKGVAQDAAALPAGQALRMATINGARAIGLEDQIGSIEVGKLADIIAVRMDELENLPLYNLPSQIVYASNRRQVSDVWVAGERVLRQGELTNINIDEVRDRTNFWQAKITREISHA